MTEFSTYLSRCALAAWRSIRCGSGGGGECDGASDKNSEPLTSAGEDSEAEVVMEEENLCGDATFPNASDAASPSSVWRPHLINQTGEWMVTRCDAEGTPLRIEIAWGTAAKCTVIELPHSRAASCPSPPSLSSIARTFIIYFVLSHN